MRSRCSGRGRRSGRRAHRSSSGWQRGAGPPPSRIGRSSRSRSDGARRPRHRRRAYTLRITRYSGRTWRFRSAVSPTGQAPASIISKCRPLRRNAQPCRSPRPAIARTWTTIRVKLSLDPKEVANRSISNGQVARLTQVVKSEAPKEDIACVSYGPSGPGAARLRASHHWGHNAHRHIHSCLR